MGSLPNLINHIYIQVMGGKNHGCIPTVNTRKFYVLKHPTNHSGFSIGNTINIKFYSFLQKLIEQNGLTRCHGKSLIDHIIQFIFIIDNEHSASAKDKGGTKQDRITQTFRFLGCFLGFHRNIVGWLLKPKFIKYSFEFLTVFSGIDAFRRCANHIDARCLQSGSKIQRCLTTILNDRSITFFLTVNLQYILKSEGLKIKTVRNIIIGGDSLRIGINHDRFKSGLPKSKGCMNTTVIKFNSLPNTVGTTPENHNFFLI